MKIEIGFTRNNTNSKMRIQTREIKSGFFKPTYKYEWKVDTCYNLDRYMLLFEEKARMEDMQVTFKPYLVGSVSKGLHEESYCNTLTSFNEWYECRGNEKIRSIGVIINIDVKL